MQAILLEAAERLGENGGRLQVGVREGSILNSLLAVHEEMCSGEARCFRCPDERRLLRWRREALLSTCTQHVEASLGRRLSIPQSTLVVPVQRDALPSRLPLSSSVVPEVGLDLLLDR